MKIKLLLFTSLWFLSLSAEPFEEYVSKHGVIGRMDVQHTLYEARHPRCYRLLCRHLADLAPLANPKNAFHEDTLRRLAYIIDMKWGNFSDIPEEVVMFGLKSRTFSQFLDWAGSHDVHRELRY